MFEDDGLRLSRAPNPDRDAVEVRVKLSPRLVAVLDQKCSELETSRTAYVTGVVARNLRNEVDAALSLIRSVESNPPLGDSDINTPGDRVRRAARKAG